MSLRYYFGNYFR